jgi:ribosomal protein L4
VVENWGLDKPKTKDFAQSLATLGLAGKTLIVDSLDNENLLLSARNLHHAKVVNSFGLNIYDLLYHDQLVLSRDAANELEQLLGARNGEDGGATAENENAGAEAAAAKPKRARKAKEEEAA